MMFVELKERTYHRGGYISVSVMFGLDDIARVVECSDDYNFTNVVTKDKKIHTVPERYDVVVKKINEALREAKEVKE